MGKAASNCGLDQRQVRSIIHLEQTPGENQ